MCLSVVGCRYTVAVQLCCTQQLGFSGQGQRGGGIRQGELQQEPKEEDRHQPSHSPSDVERSQAMQRQGTLVFASLLLLGCQRLCQLVQPHMPLRACILVLLLQLLPTPPGLERGKPRGRLPHGCQLPRQDLPLYVPLQLLLPAHACSIPSCLSHTKANRCGLNPGCRLQQSSCQCTCRCSLKQTSRADSSGCKAGHCIAHWLVCPRYCPYSARCRHSIKRLLTNHQRTPPFDEMRHACQAVCATSYSQSTCTAAQV